MSNSFHYLLMANQAIIHKKLLGLLSDTDLTLGQPKILDYLKDFEGVTQKDIAKACFIEPASLTTVLKGMETKNLIYKEMLNGNRRSNYIFLTPYGKKMAARVADAFTALENDVFSCLSKEEQENFQKTFTHIFNLLSSQGE